jgi:prephenate dehydrogenase
MEEDHRLTRANRKTMAKGIDHITIVGAGGQMGCRFSTDFAGLGLAVSGLGRTSSDEEVRAALSGCDLLLLSVPVTAMDGVLDRLAPHLEEPTVLCDVGSVKVMPVKAMVDRYAGPVVGTHPLFGAVVPEGFEPRVAVMPGRERDADAAARVADLFTRCGYTCFASTPEEHDRAMAYIQGLNYTSTVAFLAAARDVDGIRDFVTPSFTRRLDSAAKMLTQDTELFEIISEANPFLQEVSRKFMSYLSLAAGGDLELLADRAQWWWRNEKSY